MSHYLSTFTAFMKDLKGLERSICFSEACIQLVGLTNKSITRPESAHLIEVANELNLVRRFFRLFDWIDCLLVAGGIKPGLDSSLTGIWYILDVSRWLALGAFLFLDMLVLPSLLGFELQLYAPAGEVQIQALACWFQFIAISIILALRNLVLEMRSADSSSSSIAKRTRGTPNGAANGKLSPAKRRRKASKGSQSSIGDVVATEQLDAPKSWARYEGLATSCCDIFIPAHFCGYFVTDMVIVSAALAMSSLLTVISRWNTISANVK